jgi:hypothetical protein
MNIKKASLPIWILFVAILIAAGSVTYQQDGPFMGVHGNMCGPAEGGQLCIAPVLQGGWPVPFLFDSPTLSVPDTLFIEDDMNWGFFCVDVVFYIVIGQVLFSLRRHE